MTSESKESSYLIHYGVMGMKWGVRKDDKKGSSSRRSKANEEGSLALTLAPFAAMAAITVAPHVHEFLRKPFHSINDRRKKLGQDIFDTITKRQKATKDIPNASKEIQKLTPKEINPSDGNMNCTACAVASCLRMKGVNASAKNIPPQKGDNVVRDCFKGSVTDYMSYPTKEKVTKHILKQPDGSYGVIGAPFKFKGVQANIGHAFNYVVNDRKVKFLDFQSDCDIEDLSKDIGGGLLWTASITRLNDCEVDFKKLKKYVNVKGSSK